MPFRGDLSQFKGPIILVMGLAGSGKTAFINHFTNANLSVGTTADTTHYVIGMVDDVEVAFIDTPGFPEHFRSAGTVLVDIDSWMRQNLGGKPVVAILYLHSIMAEVEPGPTSDSYELFLRFVGSNSMKNVALISSHCDELQVSAVTHREAIRIGESWGTMIEQGAGNYRSFSDLQSVSAIVKKVLRAQPVFLPSLKDGPPLSETPAGRFTIRKLGEEIRKLTELVKIGEAMIVCDALSQTDKQKKEEEVASLKEVLTFLRQEQRRVETAPGWIKRITATMITGAVAVYVLINFWR